MPAVCLQVYASPCRPGHFPPTLAPPPPPVPQLRVLRWVRQLATDQLVLQALEEVRRVVLRDRPAQHKLALSRSATWLCAVGAMGVPPSRAACGCSHAPLQAATQAGAVAYVVAQLRQPEQLGLQADALGALHCLCQLSRSRQELAAEHKAVAPLVQLVQQPPPAAPVPVGAELSPGAAAAATAAAAAAAAAAASRGLAVSLLCVPLGGCTRLLVCLTGLSACWPPPAVPHAYCTPAHCPPCPLCPLCRLRSARRPAQPSGNVGSGGI